jgi:hypothetical protein
MGLAIGETVSMREGMWRFVSLRSPLRGFNRDLVAVAEFDRARRGGAKYDAALALATQSVREKWPETKISPTMVKRALAKWQPEGANLVRIVLPVPEMEAWEYKAFGLEPPPPTQKRRIAQFLIEVGPRPQYAWGGGPELEPIPFPQEALMLMEEP